MTSAAPSCLCIALCLLICPLKMKNIISAVIITIIGMSKYNHFLSIENGATMAKSPNVTSNVKMSAPKVSVIAILV